MNNHNNGNGNNFQINQNKFVPFDHYIKAYIRDNHSNQQKN